MIVGLDVHIMYNHRDGKYALAVENDIVAVERNISSIRFHMASRLKISEKDIDTIVEEHTHPEKDIGKQ
jgi:hypothetical protein